MAGPAPRIVDHAGRAIAGLIGYNPGPGIYSRLERAIQEMPANVRVQELPGLLKRYKEGVPGWELKATDLDSTIAGRDVVPRDELLAAVRERSPVYTHQELIFGEPRLSHLWDDIAPTSESGVRPLGMGAQSGPTQYPDYSHGGTDYTELLLLQPNAKTFSGNHWSLGGPEAPHWARDARDRAVAHARFDTHGDALRIVELQSDLGIHNRKAREAAANSRPVPERRPNEPAGAYEERLIANGFSVEWDRDGGMRVFEPDRTLPFPLEDAWADLLIKRLALEAARKGYRAIEVASPRAIADKVGGNIDNYEHFYGKVVPGAIERLGRKMGGLTPDNVGTVPEARPNALADMPQYGTHQELRDQFRAATGDDQPGPNFWRLYSGMRYDSLTPAEQAFTYDRFGGSHPVSQAEGGLPQEMYEYLHSLGLPPEHAQRITSHAMYLAPHNARAMHNFAVQEQLPDVGRLLRQNVGEVGRRYIMSDEMRRRILTQGIGASLLAPMAVPREE